MARLWTWKRRKRTAPRPDVLATRRCHPCGDAGDLLTNSLHLGRLRNVALEQSVSVVGQDERILGRESEATLRPCLFDQRKEESDLARAGGSEKLGRDRKSTRLNSSHL